MSGWYERDSDGVITGPLPIERARMQPIDERIVAKDMAGEVEVSTVFLGLDHSHGSGPPILFESMIFGGDFDGWDWRYATEPEAIAGHATLLTALREGRNPAEAMDGAS